jgi:hypothetical protein
MKKILTLVAVSLASISLLVGCKTVPPGGGPPVYDPVKTEQVKAAIEPLVISLLQRGVLKNPEARPYLEAMTSVLEQSRDNKRVDPMYLDAALSGALNGLPSDKEWAQYVRDVKNGLTALYVIFWHEKTQLNLSEEAWGYHLTDLFARVLRKTLDQTAPVQ